MIVSLNIQLITISIAVVYRESIHTNTVNRNQWHDSYDYIVIGSGASGSVVAGRLSEDMSASVLLLEAGDRQTIITDIPGSGVIGTGFVGNQYDWNYTNVKQENMGLGFVNQTLAEPRGKILGGSSAINGMAYNRGNKKDFDNWATTYGAYGWSYKEVLPYFRKSERNLDQRIVRRNPVYHGTNGPLGIKSYSDPDPIFVLQQRALNELGIPTVDLNGPKQLGTAIGQSFIDEYGMRSTTANAYLDPNPYKNLHILTKALATKIMFKRNEENSKLTAIGVQFIKNNNFYSVKARKEVIVCAGALKSPQVLMLSGIGPKEELDKHRIPVLAELPVGKNYQDHPGLYLLAIMRNNSLIKPPPELNAQQMYELFTKYSGLLSRRIYSFTYFNSKNNEDIDWPNIATQTVPYTFDNNITKAVSKYCSHRTEWIEYYKEFIDKRYIELENGVVRPRSFGSIRISSSNPFDKPLIDPRFLTHPKDLEDMVEIGKLSIFLIQNTFLSNYAYLPKTPIPGCNFCREGPLYKCDQYVRCAIRQIGVSYNHSGGGNRMGSINRNDVVVDHRLRVKNIRGLRVCDASIMPTLVNGNTWAASTMIGEKCAQMVREDNQLLLIRNN